MKRNDVVSLLDDQIEELTERYGIVSLFLIGSVARDEEHADSDVDLLVGFLQPIGLFKFIELQQRLAYIIGCKVDPGTKRSLKSHLKD